jgi:hypothetical protein
MALCEMAASASDSISRSDDLGGELEHGPVTYLTSMRLVLLTRLLAVLLLFLRLRIQHSVCTFHDNIRATVKLVQGLRDGT